MEIGSHACQGPLVSTELWKCKQASRGRRERGGIDMSATQELSRPRAASDQKNISNVVAIFAFIQ